MDVILSSNKWKIAIFYLDYMDTFGKTPQQHINHVQNVLSLLHNASAAFKLKKCNYLTDIIEYLDTLTHQWRLELASHTTEAILGPKPPTNLKEIRLFLDLCIVLVRFVSSFARIAALLNQRLKNDQPVSFTLLNCDKLHARETLKNVLTSPSI